MSEEEDELPAPEVTCAYMCICVCISNVRVSICEPHDALHDALYDALMFTLIISTPCGHDIT